MGFEVVHAGNTSNQAIWCLIDDSDTVYVGSIVEVGQNGIKPITAPSGDGSTTAEYMPFGIVIGTNNKTPVFSTTYNADYITDATPKGSTTEFVGVEGPWPKGGRVAMAKVIPLTAETVIRGPLYHDSAGTALTTGTITGANTSNVGCTTDSLRFGNENRTNYMQYKSTIYFRTGTNAGQYRILHSASSTNLLWGKPLNATPAVGDVITVAQVRPFGFSKIKTLTEATGIDNGADASADNYWISVRRLDLSQSGKEYIEFTFMPQMFNPSRDV